MAESYVQITEGSGKKLHSFQRAIGGNTVEDEVVIQGLPYLATYTVSHVAAASAATAASHLMQIMAGSSLNVYVRRIRVWQAVLAGALTAGAISIRRLSTAGTGGTALSVMPLDTTDVAAGATAMTLPTVKGTTGSPLSYRVAVYLAAWPATGGQPALVADWQFGDDTAKMIRIPAGTTNGIAVQNDTGVASASVFTEVELIEANF